MATIGRYTKKVIDELVLDNLQENYGKALSRKYLRLDYKENTQ